jgi:hypothetical protein
MRMYKPFIFSLVLLDIGVVLRNFLLTINFQIITDGQAWLAFSV